MKWVEAGQRWSHKAAGLALKARVTSNSMVRDLCLKLEKKEKKKTT